MKLRILATLILAFFFLAAFKCGGDEVFDGGYSTKNKAMSPKGATVYSATKIDPRIPPLVDEGADRLASATKAVYQQSIPHPNFVAALQPRSSRCQNPGFLIDGTGSPWDQTEWDKDPRPGHVLLCVAGMLPPIQVWLATTPVTTALMFVVDDVGIMPTIISYEGEHWALLFFDTDKYLATAGVHAHPLIVPKTEGLSADYQAFTMEMPEDKQIDNFTVKKGSRFCIILTK